MQQNTLHMLPPEPYMPHLAPTAGVEAVAAVAVSCIFHLGPGFSSFIEASVFHLKLRTYGSKAKIFFQSSFMLMTVQPPFFASAMSASLKVPMCDLAL